MQPYNQMNEWDWTNTAPDVYNDIMNMPPAVLSRYFGNLNNNSYGTAPMSSLLQQKTVNYPLSSDPNYTPGLGYTQPRINNQPGRTRLDLIRDMGGGNLVQPNPQVTGGYGTIGNDVVGTELKSPTHQYNPITGGLYNGNENTYQPPNNPYTGQNPSTPSTPGNGSTNPIAGLLSQLLGGSGWNRKPMYSNAELRASIDALTPVKYQEMKYTTPVGSENYSNVDTQVKSYVDNILGTDASGNRNQYNWKSMTPSTKAPLLSNYLRIKKEDE